MTAAGSGPRGPQVIGDPATAPRRTDLGFLTSRSRRRATPTATPPPARSTSPTPAPTAGGTINYVRPTPASNGTIDYRHPSRRSSASPAPPKPPPPRPAPTPPRAPEPVGHNPLDLSTPTPVSTPPPTPAPVHVIDDLLDLSGGSSTPAVPDVPTPSRPNSAGAQPPSIHPIRRLDGDDRELLTPARPTLALTRVQSGVGRLEIELHAPSGQALAVACIVTDAEGESTVVDPTHPHSPPLPSNTDPLITFSNSGFGSFGINLRRSRELGRLIIVATSVTGQPIDWAGTLSITTFGGGRADIPIDATPASTTTIVASIYNVDGEYVLRAEGQPMTGSLREAGRSFGFDTISWLDARTPIS